MSDVSITPGETPVFTYQSPEIPALIYNLRTDFAILLVWLCVLFGLVYYAFVRYDVR